MRNSSLLILLSGILIISCNQPTITQENVDNNVDIYSSTYKPYQQINKDHVERIKGVAPELKELIIAHALERKIPGVAYGVVADGQLVVADGTGIIDIKNNTPATPSSVFRIASMSKSFTAMAILKLRDEGKLSLEDYAEIYIPELKNLNYLTSDAPPIRIVNLLTMSAGFPEDNPWGDRQLDESDQMLMDLMISGAAFSTSTAYQYEYSNTGYALLGHIISKVSGMPYQEYISNAIFEPLGMTSTYWEFDNVPGDKLVKGYRWEDEQWKDEPMLHDGSYGSMGGLITTIEDFSKYVNFHLSAWPARSTSDDGPIKRSSIREMQNARFVRLNPNSTSFTDEPCPSLVGYGYGLRITEYCDGFLQVGHGGALPGFGSNYVFYPEYGVGIMAFGNLTYTGPYPLQKIENLLFGQLGLAARALPISDILAKRTEQVTELIQSWNPALEDAILAENFFLDKSREHRKAEIDLILAEAGTIKTVLPIKNYNELRGRFEMEAENGTISVYFTMSPEAKPRVQQLRVEFMAN